MRHDIASTVLGFALAVSGLAGSALGAPALQDYAILAGDKVTVGGGSQVDGLVGTHYTSPVATQFAITVAGAAAVNGDVRSADNIKLNNGAHILGAAYHPSGTTISMGAGATVGSDVVVDPELPSLPAPAVFASGGPSHTGLGNGATLTLAPGSYQDVILGGACTLNLSSGTYYFNELRSANGLDLRIDLSGGPIQIYVTTQAAFGSVDVLLPNGGGPADIYLEAHGSGTATYNAFSAAGGSDWLGTVFAPYGGIHFGGSGCCSSFQGHFWSGTHVDIEHGVNGTPVSVTSSTWSDIKQSYR
jgi:hypothetical protein